MEVERHAFQSNPIASFYFWNRTCREIALAPFCLACDFQVATPYLHSSLLEFLFALPVSDFGRPGFHDETIRLAFPTLAHIPYASVNKRRAGKRMQPKAVDQIAFVRYLSRAIRQGLVQPRFGAMRLARILGTQDTRMDTWWLGGMFYLIGLSELAGG